MAKIKLKLTEEHIALLKGFRFKKINEQYSGLDTYELYGGTYLYEEMAILLGLYDKFIPGTENDPQGRQFPDEIKQHMRELDEFMLDNLYNLENIVHQFIGEGVKPGIYECIDYEQNWTYKSEV